ncbi:hypothetical protein Goari_011743 [Gossypium aridum]|uniref:Uncharacterized protein n=1 Tax=Gossypium aridum TaxID=34290 RepID=A0A7J8WYB8_GOSAI|nr:hypothetical protein [Gossypium aridum]
MRAFIISVNEAAWEAIEDKWVRPIVAIVDGTTHLKEISKYIDKEQRIVKNIDEFKKQLALLIKSMKRLSKKGTKLDDNGIKKNTIKCYKYKGFDLFQSECANTKKKEKSLAITWSDEESFDVK